MQRKRDEGSAEGRWMAMHVLRESWKVFCTDSMRRLASLGRGEPLERESACRSLTVCELQSRDMECASSDRDGSLALHLSVTRAWHHASVPVQG